MINTDDEQVKKYIILAFICISVILNIYFNKVRDSESAINIHSTLQFNQERIFMLFKKDIKKLKSVDLLMHNNNEHPGLYVTDGNKENKLIHNCTHFHKTDLNKLHPTTIRDADVMAHFFRECNFLKHVTNAKPTNSKYLNKIQINNINSWPSQMKSMIFGKNTTFTTKYITSHEFDSHSKFQISLDINDWNYDIQEITRADFDHNDGDNILIFIRKYQKNNPSHYLRYIMVSQASKFDEIQFKEMSKINFNIHNINKYKEKYPKRKTLLDANTKPF